MSKQYISPNLRHNVAKFSRHRCGYCLTAQSIIGPFLEIDHIIPESQGGSADESNLILACPMCNGRKSNRTEAIDPQTGKVVPLFNPRTENWHEHFAWLADGAVIHGKSASGRATVIALEMNHDDIVSVRQRWVEVGWHPPQD
jgi:hypothetical protein